MYFTYYVKHHFCFFLGLKSIEGGAAESSEIKVPRKEKPAEERLSEIDAGAKKLVEKGEKKLGHMNAQARRIAEAEGGAAGAEKPKAGEALKDGEKNPEKREQSQNPSLSTELISSMNITDAEIATLKKEFPGEVSQDVLVEKAAQKRLDSYASGEMPEEEQKQLEALFESHGLGNVLADINLDTLEKGEAIEVGADAKPEEIQGAQKEVEANLQTIQLQIQTLPTGNPQRQALERRSSLLSGLLQGLQGALSGQEYNGGLIKDYGNIESNGSRAALETAQKHIGISEHTGQADKFLCGLARSARTTPWCAGFVSYTLKEAGYNIKPTLSSKSFIGESGKGHVAFYAGNNTMLGGNQSDQVSIHSIRKPITGWTTPEDLEAGKPPHKGSQEKPPVGSIIVFDRGSSQRNWV